MLVEAVKKTSVQSCDVWWDVLGLRRAFGEITESNIVTCDYLVVVKLD